MNDKMKNFFTRDFKEQFAETEAFCKLIGSIYLKHLEQEDNKDYRVNWSQMEKYLEIVRFFRELEEQEECVLEDIGLEPKERSGGLTAHFILADFYGEQISKVVRMMEYLSAITIDTTEYGVCISLTVPDVFEKIYE